MFTFDRFEPGEVYGEHVWRLSPEAVADWRSLFPDDDTGPLMPPGMTAAVTMRAYGALISPRPLGNIHGAQTYEMHRLPEIGETLTTTIRCENKEIRKGRRWVYLGIEARDEAGEPVFTGRFTSLVAA